LQVFGVVLSPLECPRLRDLAVAALLGDGQLGADEVVSVQAERKAIVGNTVRGGALGGELAAGIVQTCDGVRIAWASHPGFGAGWPKASVRAHADRDQATENQKKPSPSRAKRHTHRRKL
jgi:hypothetical protein